LAAGAQRTLRTEQKIYDTVNNEGLSIDEVIRHSGLPASVASVALLSLEMKRLVRQLPAKCL